jgi:hypothetical protein
MPRLIPTVSVGVSRKIGGRQQTIFPTIGELFEFTDEEVKQLRAGRPENLRRPVNEMARAVPERAEVTSEDEGEVVEEEVVEEEVVLQEGAPAPRPLTTSQQRREAAERQRREAAERRRGITHRTVDDDL